VKEKFNNDDGTGGPFRQLLVLITMVVMPAVVSGQGVKERAARLHPMQPEGRKRFNFFLVKAIAYQYQLNHLICSNEESVFY
jgi:hypothetical protein